MAKVRCAVRIAFVAAGGFDESGLDRVTPALLWLIERLARSHDVSVYVLQYHDRPRRYELCGATVHDLGRPRGLWRQYAALVRAIRQEPAVDVLHGYMALPAGFAAASAGRRLGIGSVVTFDSGEFASLPDIDYGLQRRSRQRLAVAATARLADRVTVCSPCPPRRTRWPTELRVHRANEACLSSHNDETELRVSQIESFLLVTTQELRIVPKNVVSEHAATWPNAQRVEPTSRT